MGPMDNEELPFISSSPLLATQNKPVTTQDEKDLSTLKRVLAHLEQRIAEYQTIDRLEVNEVPFTVQQQLAVNKSIVYHLQEEKLMIETVINNIKEKYSGR